MAEHHWTGGHEPEGVSALAKKYLLNLLYEVLFDLGRTGANWNLDHPLRASWEKVRAAIAKLEGRS